MPRVLEIDRCPHCKAELPSPTPRVCPGCGGSLQKRYLESGCLSSRPLLMLLGLGLWGLWRSLAG
jgi:predicted amidophosphoribosyltransferase